MTDLYRDFKGPSPHPVVCCLCSTGRDSSLSHHERISSTPATTEFSFVCFSNWSFCGVRDTGKKTDTWCFCCGIRALFFVFIGLIIIHVDLTEMEGEASKSLYQTRQADFIPFASQAAPAIPAQRGLAASRPYLGSRWGFSICSD